jgi:hypothetical protein
MMIKNDIKSLKMMNDWVKIPFDDEIAERELKKLIRFGGMKYQDDLIIVITVPLISIEKMEMYEIYSVPTIENNFGMFFK